MAWQLDVTVVTEALHISAEAASFFPSGEGIHHNPTKALSKCNKIFGNNVPTITSFEDFSFQ
jgi:hypothetical protein